MALNTNGLLPLLTPDYPGLDLNANQGPKIIAVSAVLIAISTIAVILRFMSRMVSKAGLWWDDWLIVAAMVRYARGGISLGTMEADDGYSLCPGEHALA